MLDEIDFDIIFSDKNDYSSETEIIKIAMEIVEHFSKNKNFIIELNHGYLVELILEAARVPIVLRNSVSTILCELGISQNFNNIKSQLLKFNLSTAVIEQLELFYLKCNYI